MLDAEADEITKAHKYERTEKRVDTRAGHYNRKLATKAGEVTLRMPKLRKLPFETAIIERYKRREESVEEALIEMYLAGVSVRRVEDISEALWGAKVSPGTISNLNQKAYVQIEEWRNRKLEVEYREIIGAAEGGKEEKESWLKFLRSLKERGLSGVRLMVGDKCLGLVEAIREVLPDTDYQRCIVHFMRNVFTEVPRTRGKEIGAKLKAIFAQEDREACLKKAAEVAQFLRENKMKTAARTLENGIDEALTYTKYPHEHWLKIRSNNGIERINREIRRRTNAVGSFPDGNSALMLVCARLRFVSASEWGVKTYLNMDRLYDLERERKAEKEASAT